MKYQTFYFAKSLGKINSNVFGRYEYHSPCNLAFAFDNVAFILETLAVFVSLEIPARISIEICRV